LLSENENFAFETTLATRSYKNKIEEAKKNGYQTTLLFFWLQNVELAKERVRIRVSEGGHNIEPDVIERRYSRGIKNLFDIYLPIVDAALIFDNSEGKHELLADKQIDGLLNIINQEKFDYLKNCYDN
jgi:predicted ABC-type ATPase